MVFSRNIFAVAALLLAAAEAADSLFIGGLQPSAGAHIGDALTVAYSAPDNEVVTVGLVQVSSRQSQDYIPSELLTDLIRAR